MSEVNTSEAKFKVGDVWLNGRGEERQIVCTDAPGSHPVVAIWVTDAGFTGVGSFTLDGMYDLHGQPSDSDLVSKVEPPWEGEVWVHPDGSVAVGGSKFAGGGGWRRIRVREVR